MAHEYKIILYYYIVVRQQLSGSIVCVTHAGGDRCTQTRRPENNYRERGRRKINTSCSQVARKSTVRVWCIYYYIFIVHRWWAVYCINNSVRRFSTSLLPRRSMRENNKNVSRSMPKKPL